MKSIYRIVGKSALAIVVGLTSLPIALLSANSFSGLSSSLIVPVFFVAVMFAIIARKNGHRIWWFAFAFGIAAWLLFLSQLWETTVHYTALYLQRLSHSGTISLTQRIIEPTALALIFLVPLLGSVVTGIGLGHLSQLWIQRGGDASSEGGRQQWRFSVREMLIATSAVCVLLGIVSVGTRAHQAAENDSKNAFLKRFEASFTTSNVRLRSKPTIIGGHRNLVPESGYTSFMAPGQNEYRVIAPISKNNIDLWCVWAYTCNGDNDDWIYKFAYAEAPTRDQLPAYPFPLQAYLSGTGQMVDGVPK